LRIASPNPPAIPITSTKIWDEEKLNQARLDWHQLNPSTQYSKYEVIAIDNVLIDHDGKSIEDVGWYWDRSRSEK